MDKFKAICLIERYRNVSKVLGLHEDEKMLDDIIDLLSKYDEGSVSGKKKSKYGETDFYNIVSEGCKDLGEYGLNEMIVLNKDKMLEFWDSLDEENKKDFTIFELNIILYLISDQYNKYQKKDKQKVQNFIDSVVRDKKMEESYKNIKV